MHYHDHPQHRAGARPLRYMPEEGDHWRSGLLVGDRVRTDLAYLGRIVGFHDTWSHPTSGRLVRIDPIGPSYASAGYCVWESRLAEADNRDLFGRHPHHHGCPCGLVYDGPLGMWRSAPASWQVGPMWRVADPHPCLSLVAS